MHADIALLPGDGIGPEVTAAALTVLRSLARRHGHTFDFHEYDIGGIAIDRHHQPAHGDFGRIAATGAIESHIADDDWRVDPAGHNAISYPPNRRDSGLWRID